MNLSQEQIARIDGALAVNKVNYDDIKLELTDHIASDIEEIMSFNKEIPFEAAFAEAFKKWGDQLKLGDDKFWRMKNTPQLVRIKLIEQFKTHFLILGSLSIIFTVAGLGIMKLYDNEYVINLISLIYVVFYVAVIVSLIIFRRLIIKSKIKTTFSEQFVSWSKASIIPMIYLLLMFIFINVSFYKFSHSHSIFHYFFPLGFLFINLNLFDGISSFYFLHQHFQFEKKLSKV